MAIVSCESGFDPLAVNHNLNGTTDIGPMQINSIHWKFFRHLGLDVKNDPIDNLEAGAYLLSTNGTRDYLASRACWSSKLDSFEMFDEVGTSSLPLFVALKN